MTKIQRNDYMYASNYIHYTCMRQRLITCKQQQKQYIQNSCKNKQLLQNNTSSGKKFVNLGSPDRDSVTNLLKNNYNNYI